MSGYCSIERSKIEIAPNYTIARAMQMAKIGRLTKNRSIGYLFVLIGVGITF